MASQRKIINDPVFGFISIPDGLIFHLVEHPYVQRLRRIAQVGLTHYVYPGAVHTRFHHALGALHLTRQAIYSLRNKDVEITDEEATAVQAAILLHDIGHGPFSHALEEQIVDGPHEDLSLCFMEALKKEMGREMHMAIQIFKDDYEKPFLHQLVSGQLDMDRMDYLSRDSFYTGVAEGVIGYDRIIKMLNVKEDQLVVEEKGIYSIEKFLIARRLMYWQVYLHKTVLAAEKMLVRWTEHLRKKLGQDETLPISNRLKYFLVNDIQISDIQKNEELLKYYSTLDDIDIQISLKNLCDHDDPVLAMLSRGIVHRQLFRIELTQDPFPDEKRKEIRKYLTERLTWPPVRVDEIIIQGVESNQIYSKKDHQIRILMKDGSVRPMTDVLDIDLDTRTIEKYYMCYAKL